MQEKLENIFKKLGYSSIMEEIFHTTLTAQTAQKRKLLFSNVAYGLTVYKTGLRSLHNFENTLRVTFLKNF